MKVQLINDIPEADAAEYGIMCADCDNVLVEQYGRKIAPIWGRRDCAIPACPENDHHVTWGWTLICEGCAAKVGLPQGR